MRRVKPRGSAETIAFVEPMKALATREIPKGDWLLEIKYDGYRALAAIDRGDVILWSRNRKRLTESFEDVAAELRRLRLAGTLLDGEIAALDAAGRPSFQLLQGARQGSEDAPIVYYLFDVLRVKGRSVLGEPIERRRALLEKIVPRDHAILRLSPVFDLAPAALLAEVRRQGLEGIVAKERGSVYEPGQRSGAWLKCRIASDQEFVIAGFTPPKGTRPHFGALLVGYYAGDRLLYAGKVGTGFNDRLLASLHTRFQRERIETCPFANLPMPKHPRFGQGMTAREMREVTWLRPALIAQVRFAEWTRDGLLRQPVFLGLREDKSPREVVRE